MGRAPIENPGHWVSLAGNISHVAGGVQSALGDPWEGTLGAGAWLPWTAPHAAP